MSHPALAHLPTGFLHHGEQMLALVESTKPAVIVELGTFLGASAIAMARVAKTWGGVVYCVDTWTGRPKLTKTKLPYKLYFCAANLVIADVAPWIRLIPATTLQAAAAWTGPPIDLLYVDADHSYEGCLADLMAWTPHVRPGGWLVGDDYNHPTCPGVKRAWDEFGSAHGLTVSHEGTPGTTPAALELVIAEWGLGPPLIATSEP